MPHHNTIQDLAETKNIYRNVYEDTTFFLSAPRLLITRWKGSCIKLIWADFVTFVFLYLLLSVIYRYVLFDYPQAKEMFEVICVYANQFSQLIPITFLIGFYVSSVVNRWWDQFMTLPRPDKLALKLVNFCPGTVSLLNLNFRALSLFEFIPLNKKLHLNFRTHLSHFQP